MQGKLLTAFALAGCVLVAGIGCNRGGEAATSAAQSPAPKQPDATAADYAKQVNENPNISPDVKKVIGGAGR
jgi:hypothetical protein